ncbi:MAG: hypothetical protein PVH64_02080 [Bacillota bacterium]
MPDWLMRREKPHIAASLGRSLHCTTFDDANVETLSSANLAKSIGASG